MRVFANDMGPPRGGRLLGRAPFGLPRVLRGRKGVPEAERSEPLRSRQVLRLAVLPGWEGGPLLAARL